MWLTKNRVKDVPLSGKRSDPIRNVAETRWIGTNLISLLECGHEVSASLDHYGEPSFTKRRRCPHCRIKPGLLAVKRGGYV